MWRNLRCTFTSPAQTDSAEWCSEQTVIALGVFSIRIYIIYMHIVVVVIVVSELIAHYYSAGISRK